LFRDPVEKACAEAFRAPLTARQKEKLTEGDKYLEAALRLRREGKLVEAIAAGEKLLAIERVVYGAEHDLVLETMAGLASLRERVLDFPAAEKARGEILRVQNKRFGEKSWQATDARLDLQDLSVLKALDAKAQKELNLAHQWMIEARTYDEEGKYREAVDLAEKALAVRVRWLGEENRVQSLLCADRLGIYLNDARQFKRARSKHALVLALQKKALGTRIRMSPARSAAWANRSPKSELLKALPKDVVLVDYLVYHHTGPDPGDKGKTLDEPRLTAFVLRPDKAVVRLDLGPMEPIEKAIDAWRRLIKSQAGADHPGMTLRRLLWLPLEKHLDGSAPTRTSKFQKWVALDGTRGEIVAIRDSFERKNRKGRVTILRYTGAACPPAKRVSETCRPGKAITIG